MGPFWLFWWLANYLKQNSFLSTLIQYVCIQGQVFELSCIVRVMTLLSYFQLMRSELLSLIYSFDNSYEIVELLFFAVKAFYSFLVQRKFVWRWRIWSKTTSSITCIKGIFRFCFSYFTPYMSSSLFTYLILSINILKC